MAMDPLRLVSRHPPREHQRLPWVPLMAADVQRELAEALAVLRTPVSGSPFVANIRPADIAAALLPTVQALIADAEKRAAAAALRDAAATAPLVRFDNGYPVKAVPVSDLLSFAAAVERN